MHLKELLKRPAPKEPTDILPAENNLLIDCGKPPKEKVYGAIKQPKSGKTAEPDRSAKGGH